MAGLCEEYVDILSEMSKEYNRNVLGTCRECIRNALGISHYVY